MQSKLNGKVKAGIGATLAAAVLGAGLFVANAGPSTVSPAEVDARAKAGKAEAVKVRMQVAEGYCTHSGLVILGDRKYPEQPTLQLVVPASQVPGAQPGKKFAGLTGQLVTAIGTPSSYNGKPQLKVSKLETK